LAKEGSLMPDEPGVAIAEPAEPTPDEAVPAPDEPAILTPDEAVPAPEQEPPTKVGVSETPETADEAAPQSNAKLVADFIAIAKEIDPEALEAVLKEQVEKPADVSEERLTWELERSREERTQRWNRASGQYSQFAPQQVQPQLEGIFAELNQRIQAAAQDVVDGKLEPDQMQLDPRGWAGLVLPLYQQGQQTALQAANIAAQNTVVDALEKHVAYRSLSTDERKQFREAKNTGNIDAMLTLYLDATSRANPVNIEKAKAEADTKRAELTKAFTEAQEKLGRNGKWTSGGVSASAQPRNETEARDWHATDKWTTRQLKAWLAKQER